MFFISLGPIDIGKLIGKGRENQIRIERQAEGQLTMKFPQKGSHEKMIDLSGPKSVVDYWAPYLCEEYRVKGGMKAYILDVGAREEISTRNASRGSKDVQTWDKADNWKDVQTWDKADNWNDTDWDYWKKNA